MCEVEEVYLPLTRLINLYAVAAETLHRETNLFLGQKRAKISLYHRHGWFCGGW